MLPKTDQQRARFKRLSIWFVLNLVIFIAGYLNYRLQLKHRYLYKTLNVGLCLSRAAAMVINFNLLLVWLPMCKYTLTRLAVLACHSVTAEKKKLHRQFTSPPPLPPPPSVARCQDQAGQQAAAKTSNPLGLTFSDSAGLCSQSLTSDKHDQRHCGPVGNSLRQVTNCHQSSVSFNQRVIEKAKRSTGLVVWRFKQALCLLRIKIISSFRIAVDHCTSLHTICATTITIASVIHTVAHLMNVINFSNKFDPLLGELNMAEFKGQNPVQLLVSVPGITGCLMVMVLFLMSLSSISIIRNSSYDLFQIFHRLSVLFVILLILHPSSHVLKEQNNVSRHHPDFCYDRIQQLLKDGEQTMATTPEIARAFDESVAAAASASTLSTSSALRSRHDNGNKSVESSSLRLQHSSSAIAITRPTQLSTVAGAEIVAPNRMFAANSHMNVSEHLASSIFHNNNNSSNNYNHIVKVSEGQVSSLSGLNLTHDLIKKREIHRDNGDERRTDDNGNKNQEQSNQRGTAQRTGTSGDWVISDTNGQGIFGVASDKFNLNNSSSSQPSMITWKDSIQDEPCLDMRPTFVAQSSICWYVLGAGLSCYLLDLLLRRLRRSKSTVQLLDACTDAEGNLIELVLSNNHKRFKHWLPGQFVYLNCPQIAAYEWHPFTISSMDNDSRQFTLHIKTGGDWTRKLRHELELRKQHLQAQQAGRDSTSTFTCGCYCCVAATGAAKDERESSMSLFTHQLQIGYSSSEHQEKYGHDHERDFNSKSLTNFHHQRSSLSASQGLEYSNIVNVVANFDCYDQRTGRLQVECRRFVQLATAHQDNGLESVKPTGNHHTSPARYANDCIKIDLDNIQWENAQLYTICPLNVRQGASRSIQPKLNETRLTTNKMPNLDLFIDGPFHSPFERLLEQQVSVCIANGVGWTAFSSVFQQITNNLANLHTGSQTDWWYEWRNFRTNRPKGVAETAAQVPTTNSRGTEALHSHNMAGVSDKHIKQSSPPPLTKLHLMVIVTTMEQFQPFYNIVRRYFERMHTEQQNESYQAGGGGGIIADPIREITAFITRSTRQDSDVVEFCRRENLKLANNSEYSSTTLPNLSDNSTLRVNDTLVIRFGRPNFDSYLSGFSNLYRNERKISVYCCGSYQVKRTVEQLCQSFNERKEPAPRPVYQFHEENF